ncbi:hypothetical protein AcW2_006422 [Taiwanofungus camphoratus]|nr:hypothetical protein AcW2_006422 [Antrodia cinnamomea]
MAKKKGPPYTDDPGCKYITIEDPWPGHASSKDRTRVYYNWLGAWVYFMLGKKAGPEVIFSVNTRTEVIVKLPKEVDIVPILGAHIWCKFLSTKQGADRNRISYVFEYNYRSRGEPGNHNWLEHVPHPGEPPPHIRFPVVFPYPSPHWASPIGRNLKDLALPLPSSRERTPTPPPSLFTPYEPPLHYPSHVVNSSPAPAVGSIEQSEERVEVEIKSEACLQDQPVRLYAEKHDPYEEEDAALKLVKQEPVENALSSRAVIKQDTQDMSIKQEMTDVHIKEEEPSKEQEPSRAFLAAFERLQRRRAAETQSLDRHPRVREVEVDSSAISKDMNLRAQSLCHKPNPQVKPEPQELHIPPETQSRVTVNHCDLSLRDPSNRSSAQCSSSRSVLQEVRIKPEPEDMGLPLVSLSREGQRYLSKIGERNGAAHETGLTSLRMCDPRLESGRSPLKRVKREDEGPIKRTKKEPHY